MARKRFSGNKGEWSEPYVVLRMLADGRLHQANDQLLPSPNNFVYILGVKRGDVTACRSDDGVVVFEFLDSLGRKHKLQTHSSNLLVQADKLFKAICAVTDRKGAFELSDCAKELKFHGFSRLTNPAPKNFKVTKRDLLATVKSPQTGLAELGFSVKSELGAPPTLLNASEPTNIVYRIKGLTKQQVDEINGITQGNKIMLRCAKIKELAQSIEFEKYHSKVFADNLDLVDSALPAMVADLVKVHYFQQILEPRSKVKGAQRDADKLSKAVAALGVQKPYNSKSRANYCEIKIKHFLRACALGLMPSEVWNGIDDASGGYIVVLPDGRLIAFYVYNTNLFEKYLFESTIFERGSTSKHKFMTLYPDAESDDYFIKLNLQIRFNR